MATPIDDPRVQAILKAAVQGDRLALALWEEFGMGDPDDRGRPRPLGPDDSYWPAAAARLRARIPELSLDDVRAVVRESSPYRNCQRAAAFRAPCDEVDARRPDSWCAFCQSHARLVAALAAAAAEGRNVLPDATDDQSAVIETWAQRHGWAEGSVRDEWNPGGTAT